MCIELFWLCHACYAVGRMNTVICNAVDQDLDDFKIHNVHIYVFELDIRCKAGDCSSIPQENIDPQSGARFPRSNRKSLWNKTIVINDRNQLPSTSLSLGDRPNLGEWNRRLAHPSTVQASVGVSEPLIKVDTEGLWDYLRECARQKNQYGKVDPILLNKMIRGNATPFTIREAYEQVHNPRASRSQTPNFPWNEFSLPSAPGSGLPMHDSSVSLGEMRPAQPHTRAMATDQHSQLETPRVAMQSRTLQTISEEQNVDSSVSHFVPKSETRSDVASTQKSVSGSLVADTGLAYRTNINPSLSQAGGVTAMNPNITIESPLTPRAHRPSGVLNSRADIDPDSELNKAMSAQSLEPTSTSASRAGLAEVSSQFHQQGHDDAHLYTQKSISSNYSSKAPSKASKRRSRARRASSSKAIETAAADRLMGFLKGSTNEVTNIGPNLHSLREDLTGLTGAPPHGLYSQPDVAAQMEVYNQTYLNPPRRSSKYGNRRGNKGSQPAPQAPVHRGSRPNHSANARQMPFFGAPRDSTFSQRAGVSNITEGSQDWRISAPASTVAAGPSTPSSHRRSSAVHELPSMETVLSTPRPGNNFRPGVARAFRNMPASGLGTEYTARPQFQQAHTSSPFRTPLHNPNQGASANAQRAASYGPLVAGGQMRAPPSGISQGSPYPAGGQFGYPTRMQNTETSPLQTRHQRTR